MITIAKRFTFDAAHFLPCMPEHHKCRGMHGHTYEVELVLRGHIPIKTGILVDYDEIAAEWDWVYQLIDHKVLNEVPGLDMPSTENLVTWIMRCFYNRARRDNPLRSQRAEKLWALLDRVRVSESTTTYAEMNKVEFIAFYGDMA